jgi:hypothetical protein
MPISELESLANAEIKGKADKSGLSEKERKELKKGLEKLNFYACGSLMHRILEEE